MIENYLPEKIYLKLSAERLGVGFLPPCEMATAGRDRFGNGIYFCSREEGKKCISVGYDKDKRGVIIDTSKMNECPNIAKRKNLEESTKN